MSFKSARIVLFPGGSGDILKIVNFPHPRTTQQHHYALLNDELYELTEFDNDNPHSKTNHLRATTKGDEKPVRSLLLENISDQSSGIVLEESNIILTTKFNFTYLLISYFIELLEQGKTFTRYQSLQDFIDVFEDAIPSILQLPESLLDKSLQNICEAIDENEEKFYRFSEDKALEYLKSKADLISKSFPESIGNQIVRPLVYPANIDDPIPENIMSLAFTKYSMHLLSSYLHPITEAKLQKSYNFNDLEEYIEKAQREKAQKKAAEDQIQNLNQINAQNKRNFPAQDNKSRKKPTVTKKATPKVMKGPLDGFFVKKK